MIPESPEPMMTTLSGRASSMERSSTIHGVFAGFGLSVVALPLLNSWEKRCILVKCSACNRCNAKSRAKNKCFFPGV